MATHRRGSRPSQWPVRDLLGHQRSRIAELWDPRVAAAVSGLVACGAAVGVAFTVSDSGTPDRPDVLAPAPAGPQALPAPGATVPAPAPAEPAPEGDAAPPAPRADPVPRSWRVPAPGRRKPATERAAPRPTPEPGIGERVAAELAAVREGRLAGVLVVPVQREADVRALVELSRDDAGGKGASGHHRSSGDDSDSDSDSDDSDSDSDDADDERSDRKDRGEHRECPDDDRDSDKRAADHHDRADDSDSDDSDDDDDSDQDDDNDKKNDKHDDEHDEDDDEDDSDRDRDSAEHRKDEHRKDEHRKDRGDARAHVAKHGDTWPAHLWFGDGKEVDLPRTAAAVREVADHPAMAVLVTRAHDEDGTGLKARRLDSRALAAALTDLEAADGAAR